MSDPRREQLLEGLAWANQIRSARAEFKRELKTERLLIVEAFESPADWLLTAKVMDLLLAVPKWGPVKVRKVVKGLDISSSKTVGGLSVRQRAMLVHRLGVMLDA